jgi:hypothetical protein
MVNLGVMTQNNISLIRLAPALQLSIRRRGRRPLDFTFAFVGWLNYSKTPIYRPRFTAANFMFLKLCQFYYKNRISKFFFENLFILVVSVKQAC